MGAVSFFRELLRGVRIAGCFALAVMFLGAGSIEALLISAAFFAAGAVDVVPYVTSGWSGR